MFPAVAVSRDSRPGKSAAAAAPPPPPCPGHRSPVPAPGARSVPLLAQRAHRHPVSLGKMDLLLLLLLPRGCKLIQTYFPTKPRTMCAGYSIPQSRICRRSSGCRAASLKAEQGKTCEGGSFPAHSLCPGAVCAPRGCRSGAEPRTCSASRTPLSGAGFGLAPSSHQRGGRV